MTTHLDGAAHVEQLLAKVALVRVWLGGCGWEVSCALAHVVVVIAKSVGVMEEWRS